jgi:phosphatidylglycerophosphate synthase
MMVGAVVTADIADGVVARKLDVDTNGRRIADAVVDRLSILTAFGAAAQQNPEVLGWYAPLAIRGSIIAAGSNLCFWLRNKLVLGGNFHKLASLSTAGLGVGLVAEANPSIMLPLAATTYGIGAISVLDYFGAHRRELKKERAQQLERVRVRKLNGLHSLFGRNLHSVPD